MALSAALIVLVACVPYLSTIDDYFLQDDFGVVQLMARRSWTMFFKMFANNRFCVPIRQRDWGFVGLGFKPICAAKIGANDVARLVSKPFDQLEVI